MSNIVKVIAFLTVFTSSGHLAAEEYLLDFKKKCGSNGSELKYKCEKADDYKHYIYKDNGIWKAKTLDGAHQTNFKLLREDENILVLEQATLYSGNQVIYIMKKNSRFYLVQTAYSEILKDNETTTKQGIFIKTSEHGSN